MVWHELPELPKIVGRYLPALKDATEQTVWTWVAVLAWALAALRIAGGQ